MYQWIGRASSGKRKFRELPLWAGLVFSTAVILSIIIPVIIGGRAQYVYHTMYREMAQSAVYSRNHASAWLYVGEEKYFYTAARTSDLFAFLADGGAGKPKSERELPDRDFVLLDFGDGATLQLWYDKVKGDYGGVPVDGLFISYVSPVGKRYSYTTSHLYVKELIPYVSPEAQTWLDAGLAQMDPDR